MKESFIVYGHCGVVTEKKQCHNYQKLEVNDGIFDIVGMVMTFELWLN